VPTGNAKEVEIPIEKLVIFTFDKQVVILKVRVFLGVLILTGSIKKVLYEIDAIQKERHGIGIPDIVLKPGYSQGP
jgi:hypothetical protein